MIETETLLRNSRMLWQPAVNRISVSSGRKGEQPMGKGMKAGKRPRQKAPAMQQQLQQVQAMQAMMEKKQDEIEAHEVETSAGGGAVTVKVNGRKELVDIKLSPEAVDPDDIDMLQDLIMSAVNEAVRQISEYSEAEMSKVTGGLNIPGL